MDLFDKYEGVARRHDALLQVGADPINVCMDKIVSATEAVVGGKDVILLGTNNYLGMTFDPVCIEAAQAALLAEGTGTTGSRIANGTYSAHRQLEQEIASFLGRQSALVFPTGYQANLGILAGLAGPNDVIFLDADSHASIYDGCRLSGAKLVRFRHNDPADLDRRLTRMKDEQVNKLIVVEGLYSILGDQAPLKEFAEVKRKHNAYLLVDEAHSLGVYGANGRGLAEALDCEDDADFVVGTFSKSLGAVGGFGASNHPRFETLRFNSRPYMFTASPSPSTVASVIAAIGQIRAKPELRDSIWRNASALYDGLSELGFKICSKASPIIAVSLPDEMTAVMTWNRLLQAGVYVNLALPPGTPNNSYLLRCSVSAAHSLEQIEEVCRRFAAVAAELELGNAPETAPATQVAATVG